MNETNRAHFFVFDVFPLSTSEFFSDNSGAVVSFWVAATMCATRDAAWDRASADLRREGWVAAMTIIEQVVTEATYAAKEAGRARYVEALERGMSADVVVQERQVVGAEMDPDACRVALADALGCGRVLYTLDMGEQYANGVLPDDTEFVPLWVEGDAAACWLARWPDAKAIRALPADAIWELCLEALEDGTQIGIGNAEGIVMFHPGDLLALMGETYSGNAAGEADGEGRRGPLRS